MYPLLTYKVGWYFTIHIYIYIYIYEKGRDSGGGWGYSGNQSSEVHKSGHMTAGHSVETQEFLTKEPMPCRHMPLLM